MSLSPYKVFYLTKFHHSFKRRGITDEVIRFCHDFNINPIDIKVNSSRIIIEEADKSVYTICPYERIWYQKFINTPYSDDYINHLFDNFKNVFNIRDEIKGILSTNNLSYTRFHKFDIDTENKVINLLYDTPFDNYYTKKHREFIKNAKLTLGSSVLEFELHDAHTEMMALKMKQNM